MRKMLLFLLAILLIITPAGVASASSSAPVSTPTNFDPLLVKAAFNALKSMPKKERKSKLRKALKEIKAFKMARRAGDDPSTNTLLLVILDLLLPPLAVYLHEGTTNNKFWITLLLFVLGLAGAFFFSWLLIFAAIVYGLIVILGGA